MFWNVDAMMWQYDFQMGISFVFGGAPMLINVNDDITFIYFSSHISNRTKSWRSNCLALTWWVVHLTLFPVYEQNPVMYSVSSCILSNIREILDQSKAQILVYWYISCIETIRKCIQFLQILKVILCRNRNTLDYVHSSFKYLSLVTLPVTLH